MTELQEILGAIGFSEGLIEAIKKTPIIECHETDVNGIFYQAFENDMITSTVISMSENNSAYNIGGHET